ncbi:MAG TPA: hypothetical protein VE197_04120, partial [Mycobacterium sp.]|nr:hypothetical protein [Mycobacterium sp.]
MLRRVHKQGINALILRVSALGRKPAGKRRFDSVRRFAAAEKLYVVAVLPAGKPRTRAARHVAAACSSHHFSRLRCAVQVRSVATAARFARKHDSVRQLVAVYVKRPTMFSGLARVPKQLRRRIIVIAPLYRSFNTSIWGAAIGQTAASPSVNMGIAPRSGKASPAIERFAVLLAGGSGSAAGAPGNGTPPPAPGVANVWVDTSGGSCVRSASAVGYSDGLACGSFQAAYAVAQCGDVVGVESGSYSSQSISSGAKSCSSGSQVVFTSVPGGVCSDNSRVSMPSFSISVAYVELSCMSANPSGTTSCADVSGSSHTSV